MFLKHTSLLRFWPKCKRALKADSEAYKLDQIKIPVSEYFDSLPITTIWRFMKLKQDDVLANGLGVEH